MECWSIGVAATTHHSGFFLLRVDGLPAVVGIVLDGLAWIPAKSMRE